MTMVSAACALRACGDACLEPGCECECHEVPEGIRPSDVVLEPDELAALRAALAATRECPHSYMPDEIAPGDRQPGCANCGNPIRRAPASPTGWTHGRNRLAREWQGMRCPGAITGATPRPTED
jgi:hypothetical protein